MKRTAVLKKIKAEVKRLGVTFEVTESTRHSGVRVGDVRSTLGRHNGIDEVTAGRFVDQVASVLGKGVVDAVDLMREAISFVADVPEDQVEIELVPAFDAGVQQLLADARHQRAEAQALAEHASQSFRKVAHHLADSGVSLRDVGVILGVSHQRAHQLVSEN